MRLTFAMYPREGERFAPTAFESQIGKVMPVLAELGVSQALLLEAEVAEDGRSAQLTVDGDLRLPTRAASEYPFRLAEEDPS